MAHFLRPLAASAVLALAALAASGAARAGECRLSNSGAEDMVRRMYQSISLNNADDLAAALTPDFFIFADGKRHTGAELVERMKAAGDQGKTFLFDLVEPESHLACDTVWITYENRIQITDKSGKHEDANALESAVVVWTDAGWKVRFLHSTEVPAAAQP